MSAIALDSPFVEVNHVAPPEGKEKLEEKIPASPNDSTTHDLEPKVEFPSGPKLWLMVFALCLGGFLVSLDSTVVATAVPKISDEFHSLGDIGWYSSVYFLSMCMPQLPLVKINERYQIRWTYSIAMAFFLAGSAICGAAHNSSELIAGRALAGLGSSGLLVATNALVPFLAPAPKRPIYFGLFAASMGLGIGTGPLIGGVLTQSVTWRWNFYMNLPIGGFIYGVFFIFVRPQATSRHTLSSVSSWRSFILTLDLPGLIALTPAVISIQLALQWAGSKYEWNDGRIITLLVLFGVLIIIFVINENLQGINAMLPARILKQRNLICALLFCFCSNGASTVLTYYLPIWFQGIQEDTPIQSGIHTLPLVLTAVVTTIICGAIMTTWGHAGTLMIVGSIFTAIGAGLLTTLSHDTSTGKWVGYQLLYAIGSAAGRLCPSVCFQNTLDESDVAYGFTLVTFISFLAGAIFVSVAQALFANSFLNGLEDLGLMKSNIVTSFSRGVGTLTNDLSGNDKVIVLDLFNKSIVHAWEVPVVLCCLGIIGALFIDHKVINRKPEEK